MFNAMFLPIILTKESQKRLQDTQNKVSKTLNKNYLLGTDIYTCDSRYLLNTDKILKEHLGEI